MPRIGIYGLRAHELYHIETPRDLSPSERLLQDALIASGMDDESGISDVVIEWTDNEGRRWRRSVEDEAPKQI